MQTEIVAQELVDWAGKSRVKKGCTPKSTIKSHLAQMNVMMESKDWDKAKPCHVVQLYIWCHTKVYGVPPIELDNGYEYLKACAQVSRLIKSQFDGQIKACIAFVRWTWQRESWVEKKRRESNEVTTFRLGWNFQFGPKLVTDYRLDRARREGYLPSKKL